MPALSRRSAKPKAAKTQARPRPSSANLVAIGPEFGTLLQQVKTQTDKRLSAVLERERAHNGALGEEVRLSLEAAAELTSRGGKRLRAALVLAGFEAAYDPGSQFAQAAPRAKTKRLVTEVGVAVELLQAYFLIHDDWMDQDDTRRNGPSVHAALSRSFDSVHKGACGAVLVGDYLVALAAGHFAKHAVDHPNFPQLMESFIGMQLAAVSGQLLDVIGLTRDAAQVYRLKTGSYTVNGPLKLGALLGGAQRALLGRLEAFADPVGLAFQLRDDQLGAFGNPEATGKPFGSDVREGKWTWIAQYAFANASPAQLKVLKRAFGNPQALPNELRAAVQALEATGARAAAEQLIQQQTQKARSILSRLAITEYGKHLLTSAIDTFVTRAH
jgi:geranylgeranyl diphosphate synthase type I